MVATGPFSKKMYEWIEEVRLAVLTGVVVRGMIVACIGVRGNRWVYLDSVHRGG
jgi:hypothetical protein